MRNEKPHLAPVGANRASTDKKNQGQRGASQTLLPERSKIHFRPRTGTGRWVVASKYKLVARLRARPSPSLPYGGRGRGAQNLTANCQREKITRAKNLSWGNASSNTPASAILLLTPTLTMPLDRFPSTYLRQPLARTADLWHGLALELVWVNWWGAPVEFVWLFGLVCLGLEPSRLDGRTAWNCRRGAIVFVDQEKLVEFWFPPTATPQKPGGGETFVSCGLRCFSCSMPMGEVGCHRRKVPEFDPIPYKRKKSRGRILVDSFWEL